MNKQKANKKKLVKIKYLVTQETIILKKKTIQNILKYAVKGLRQKTMLCCKQTIRGKIKILETIRNNLPKINNLPRIKVRNW